MPSKPVRRGRPPLPWEAGSELPFVPPGRAVAVELHGRHQAPTVGRTATSDAETVTLATSRGRVVLDKLAVKRFRVVDGLYEPGDPVLKRGVSAKRWRGGVVRVADTSVLVEEIDGSFVWYPEDDLEPADVRDSAPLPALPRGPVPSVTP